MISSTVGLEALMYAKPVLTLGQPFYSGYGVTLDVDSFREIRDQVPALLEFRPDRERILEFLHAAMRRCYPGAPVLVDSSDANALALAELARLRGPRRPRRSAGASRRLSRDRLRVALDLTGLELDVGGSARAIAALRAELERRDDVEVLAMAHGGRQPNGGWRRVLRGLHRELVYMPVQLPRRAAAAGADLLHCPVGVASVRSRVPLVVTVNDVMALEHPELVHARERASAEARAAARAGGGSERDRSVPLHARALAGDVPRRSVAGRRRAVRA